MKNKIERERRSKMKKLIVGILVVTLLATGGVAMAQGWGRGMGFGPGPGAGYGPGYGPGGGWGPGLNLTAEQNQKMQAMRESFFKETLTMRNEMQTKQLELRTLWAQTNPDQEKILAKQKEINALRAQLQEKTTKHRLDMRKVLTPEQQAQLGAYGPGFGPGYGMRGGFGPGRGMGYGVCPRW
jgi:Spy/CpxP family protein refolding chaperone